MEATDLGTLLSVPVLLEEAASSIFRPRTGVAGPELPPPSPASDFSDS